MSEELKDYGEAFFGQPKPDLDLQHRALAVVKAHPLYSQAATFLYCEPVVWFMDLAQSTFSGVRDRLGGRVDGLSRLLFVEFRTSTKIPQPLFGGGELFGFCLHPESLEILHTDTGTWRS